jgi:transposase
MTRFVVGDDRSQSTLFPERLDDYLGEDNPVRAIDIFVDELDLAKLGFGGVEPEATGRPAYHPATRQYRPSADAAAMSRFSPTSRHGQGG